MPGTATKADPTLAVFLGGAEIGMLRRDHRGRLTFVYAEAWRQDPQATALSLSMPLAAPDHPHAVIEPFLWGLLPDNERVLDSWARQFQVSPRNAFALIGEVGEDCAGAVQFIRQDRRESLGQTGDIRWLDEAEVAARLRELRTDPGAGRRPDDAGQFSLAGAQPKTALVEKDGRWGVPSGRIPTTHILKPPTGEFDGQAENEHFCLTLARTVGLPAASSEVRRFGDETAIVVRRYDRADTGALAAAATAQGDVARAAALSALAETQPILRLHQEDLCQALGLRPSAKYQNEGGPSPETIIQLLRTHSGRPAEDVGTFMDALIFNWLIAGSDAHAKNYSLLHGPRGRVRLAPLYDVASALPYPEFDLRRLKLAIRIGDAYRLEEIGSGAWQRFAARNRLDPSGAIARAVALADVVARQVSGVRGELQASGLRHPILERLETAIRARALDSVRLLKDRVALARD